MSVLVVNKCQILWLKLMHHIQFSWGSIPDFAGAGAPPEPPIPRGLPAPSPKNPTHALGPSGHSALPASISDPLGLDTRLGGFASSFKEGSKGPGSAHSLRSSPPRSAPAQAFTRMSARCSAHPVFRPVSSISALLR